MEIEFVFLLREKGENEVVEYGIKSHYHFRILERAMAFTRYQNNFKLLFFLPGFIVLNYIGYLFFIAV